MLDQIGGGGLQGRVDAALGALQEQEEQVLRLRFGIGTSMQRQDEIRRQLGVSGAHVRALETRALQHLRRVALETVEEMECWRAEHAGRDEPRPRDTPCSVPPPPIPGPRHAADPPPPPPSAPQGEPSSYDVNAWDEV